MRPSLLLGAALCCALSAQGLAQTSGFVSDAPPPPAPLPPAPTPSTTIPADALLLSLDEALALAVAQSPDIGSAELSAMTARILEARARLNRFSMQAGVSADSSAGVVKPWREDGYSVTGLSWGAGATAGVPLYSGGRVEATIRQAELDVVAAEWDTTTTIRAIERAVILNYWTIKSYELQLAASREALGINREALAFTQARAASGLAAPIDVNRSRVNVLDQEDSILALEGQMYATQQDLTRLLNIDGRPLVLTDEARVDVRTWPDTPEELVDLAVDERPELRRIDAEAGRAQAGVALARSGALPNVSLAGSVQLAGAGVGGGEQTLVYTDPTSGLSAEVASNPDITGQDLGPDLTAVLGLNMSWTPFNLFQVRDSVAVARLSTQQVHKRAQGQQRVIEDDVRTAFNALKVLNSRTPYIDQRLSLARDNLQIIQALYAQGSSNILDLLQAQSAYQAATVQRASHQVNLIVAEYELRWTIGERFTTDQARP